VNQPIVIHGQEHILMGTVTAVEEAKSAPFLLFFTRITQEARVTVKIEDAAYVELARNDVMGCPPQILTVRWRRKEPVPQAGARIRITIRSASVVR
jgi:hypothetical protein